VTTSPEQLSIALMAEARRQYDGASPQHLGLADRLTMWATDAREIGVQHFQQKENWRAEWERAQDKLERVVRLCKDNTGLHLAREILEALND
jgi:hypothetical protein